MALTAEIHAQITEPAAKSVTPDQVKALRGREPADHARTGTVRFVETKNRRAATAVLNKLRRGATWSALGGTKETFDKADETKTGRAVFRAKLNQTTRYGRVVFRVIKVIPEKPVPRAQQEALAWEMLAGEAQQRALDEFKAQFTAKWRQRTVCAPRTRRTRTAANRQVASTCPEPKSSATNSYIRRTSPGAVAPFR